ncbi:MAG: Eco47II family restriction endonuclease [bacterium]
MSNRYVSFVSDKDFLECVKWVCDAYPDKSKVVTMKSVQRNRIDPFKMVFDMTNSEISVDTWIKNEIVRQADKTINNRIGEFHQKLLGKVKGWNDLGVGDDSKVDIKKEDGTVFIEIKNKFNTMNSDATASCRRKLKNAVSKNTKAKAYWAYVVSKKGDSGESVWVYGGENNPRIRKIWGNRIYELITGEEDALENVWRAIPNAIRDLNNSGFITNESDNSRLVNFFRSAFFS